MSGDAFRQQVLAEGLMCECGPPASCGLDGGFVNWVAPPPHDLITNPTTYFFSQELFEQPSRGWCDAY